MIESTNLDLTKDFGSFLGKEQEEIDPETSSGRQISLPSILIFGHENGAVFCDEVSNLGGV